MINYPLRLFLLCLIIAPLLISGCSTAVKINKRISKEDNKKINNISLVVNVLFSHPTQGEIRGVDVTQGKIFARDVVDKVSLKLNERRYTVSDSHISVANWHNKNYKYLAYENLKREDLSSKAASLKSGVLFSERLSFKQLNQINTPMFASRKVPRAKHNAPKINLMNFKGDLLLVLKIRGREKASEEKSKALLTNILLLPLSILTQDKLFNTPDILDGYSINLSAFRITDGEQLFWGSKGFNSRDNLVDESVKMVGYGIRGK